MLTTGSGSKEELSQYSLLESLLLQTRQEVGAGRGATLGFKRIPSDGEALLYSQDPRKQEELRVDERFHF